MALDPLINMALDLTRFPDEFSTLFDTGPLRKYVREAGAATVTAVDVKETPESFQFIADLPGLTREDVKVQIEEGNVLTLSGERKREEKKETDTYHRIERTTGKFQRRFRLPQSADIEKISANYQNGVLTVTVNKKEPQKSGPTKTIEVS